MPIMEKVYLCIKYSLECDEDNQRELTNAINAAVQSLDSYKGCLGCKVRVELTVQPLGRCSKCSYDAENGQLH